MDILTDTFFEIFEIPVSFDYDAKAVQQRYLELQKKVHPDNFVNAGAYEKRLSMQHTSRINEAFNTLKNPVERALYLLRLKGLDINFDNETTMDAQFLMEQLELREELENVHTESDPLVKLDALSADIKDRLSIMMQQFSKYYESDEKEQARELIRKMQFLQKAQKEIGDSAAQIEDELLG